MSDLLVFSDVNCCCDNTNNRRGPKKSRIIAGLWRFCNLLLDLFRLFFIYLLLIT